MIWYDKDMKTTSATARSSLKNIARIVLGTSLILLVPLVAMQFTEEVDWNVSDFVAMGTLLIGAGLVYELLMTKVAAKYLIVVAGLLMALVLLVWVELAVGIFGTPLAGS